MKELERDDAAASDVAAPVVEWDDTLHSWKQARVGESLLVLRSSNTGGGRVDRAGRVHLTLAELDDAAWEYSVYREQGRGRLGLTGVSGRAENLAAARAAAERAYRLLAAGAVLTAERYDEE